MAKETQTPAAPVAQAPAPLDYRAHYATSLPQPSFTAPAYPLPQPNPWTFGKILMTGAGAVAFAGVCYWAYTAIKKAKAQPNPVRQLRVAPDATVATLPRAA